MNNKEQRRLSAIIVTCFQILVMVCSLICFKNGIQSGNTIVVIASSILGVQFLIEIAYHLIVLLLGFAKAIDIDEQLKEDDEDYDKIIESHIDLVKEKIFRK